MLEFKKCGNGSNCYEVIQKHSYNVITKTFKYKSLGFIQKVGKQWETLYEETATVGKSRKELAEKLMIK